MIEQLLAPYEGQLAQAESMPGWGRRAAQDAIAETGVDMTRFPPAHLVSWAGRCPLGQQPTGKNTRRAKAKKGNWYLAGLLGETSVAVGRTHTREGARYRRLGRRRGKAKAQVALGNTQLKVYPTLLSNPGIRYQDLGVDYYDRRNAHRQVRTTSGASKASDSTSPSRRPQRHRVPGGRLTRLQPGRSTWHPAQAHRTV